MEPISVSAACVGLLSDLTTVSTKVRGLSSDYKNANKNIYALQEELESCQQSLSLFYGSGDADRYPLALRADLEMVIRECSNVVGQIDQLMDQVSNEPMKNRVQWAFYTQDEVSRLHRNLEVHKSALTIAIAFASLSMTRGIKSDASSIGGKTALLPEIQDELATVLQTINDLGAKDPSQPSNLGIAMQRFLEEAYAGSIDGSPKKTATMKSYETRTSDLFNPFHDAWAVADRANITDSDERDGAYYAESIGESAMSTTRRPLLTSTSTTTRRWSSSLWKTIHSSRPRSASIAFDPVNIPVLDGKITRRSLERTSALLLVNPSKLVKNPAKYDFMGEVATLYKQTMTILTNNGNNPDSDQTNQRFNSALTRHRKNANDTDARKEFQRLATEGGHLPSHTMYATTLRYRHNVKGALVYLYAAARIWIDIEMQHGGAPFADPEKADELRIAVSEIARTFMYPAETMSAADARAFYAAGADLGDWQGMYQLGGAYLYGEGVGQDREVGRLLIVRSKAMRARPERVIEE